MAAKRCKAFISYSHGADSAFASKLQKALEAFAKPWNNEGTAQRTVSILPQNV